MGCGYREGSSRRSTERLRLLRSQRIDVIASLSGAGFINLALILLAASLFHGGGSALNIYLLYGIF